MAVRAPISLDDAQHRASYFATHEEEVTTLKEQYIANKNNVAKKNIAPKEPATKGQHSYAINNSLQNKSSTCNPNKHSALRSQNENKKTSEDIEEEEEKPATPKSNQKAKGSLNKRSKETEPESPSSPPPMLKTRVDMISWGSESHTPNRIEGQTEGRVCIDITVAIRTLENLNEATPPPSITRYNPIAGSPFRKTLNFKRKQKIAIIHELLERPIAPQIQKKDSM
ncbi:hypothetical protein Bca101_051888 [Brassica carinata]